MRSNKIYLFLILLGITTLTAVVTISITIATNLSKTNPSNLQVQIQQGTSKKEALTNIFKLYNIGNTNQKLLLGYYYIINPAITIQAGEYKIQKKTQLKEAVKNLKGGSFEQKVTFLEGWTVEENSLELKRIKGAVFAEEYYNKAKPFIGRLYPDTYQIDNNTTPEKLINRQLETFRIKTKELFQSYKKDLTEEEILKIASIVEREAKSFKDKKIIAGILIKRYANNLPLDADATSQYGLAIKSYAQFAEDCLLKKCDFNFWAKPKTLEDIKDGGEYNTRGKLGLPPTPICNPSLQAIEAVIEPQESPYLYYLTDKNGVTHYAKNLEEHIININKYL